jgi:DNA-binding winged helix-turn-helix (wHTH) protein
MTSQSDRVFKLACWTIHTDRHLIIWNGESKTRCERQLEPRLMRLLCLLADNAGKVLTREELIEALWPHVIVNENSLTRAISDLRRLLTSPDGSNNRLIETVPKRGYRLCVQPQMPTHVAPDYIPEPTVVLKPAAHQGRPWIPAIAASLILMLSVVHQWYWAPAENRIAQNATQWRDRVVTAARHEFDLQAVSKLSDSPVAIWPAGESLLSGRFDRAYADQAVMPNTLFALPLDGIANADASQTGFTQPVIAPNGDLIAFVDYHEGISRLNLRHTLAPSEPWTVFTTDERIYHIQWSPLDAGLLFSVGLSTQSTERTDYVRLMLLDLQSLTLHELYRRELPNDNELAIQKGAGSLT